MDGTYNNPYAQGQSPLTPDTPSGGAYKVNVNRAKTRKWVEAKVQNYDGDDWGDEYSDDEPEPVPPPPVSRITSGLRPVGQRLPSETHRASPRLQEIAGSGARSPNGPPSLQLQTGQSVTGAPEHAVPSIPPHMQDSPRSTPSPIAGRNASPFPLPSQQRQPSIGQIEPRSSTPLSHTTSSTPARASPLSHPAELYRLEDERKAAGSPLSIQDNVASKPAERPTPLSEEASHQVINPPPATAPAVDPSTELRGSSLLPDMRRLSLFNSDFFSSSSTNEPQVAKAAPPNDKPNDVEQPDPTGKKAITNVEVARNEPSFSLTGPTGGLVSQAPVLPVPDPRSVPPLRTPSPNARVPVPPEPMSSTSARTMNSDITPTEPLQPRRPDHSPSDYGSRPGQTEPLHISTGTSPVKESDMLSDEILRTLSPIGATPPPLGAGADSSKQLVSDNRQDTHSSGYTLQDYDSYWEDSTDKPAPESKDSLPAPPSAPVPPKEPDPEPQPPVLQVDGPASVSIMSPSSDETPALRKRFSWEAGFEHNASALKSEAPVDEPPRAGIPNTDGVSIPKIDTPSSLGQSDIQPPKEVVSDITIPRSETPKIVIPSAPEISNAPPPAQPLPSMLDPPSPVAARAEELPPDVEERRPSVLSDNVPSEPLSHVVSETSPPEIQVAMANAPLTQPRPIPQVKGVKEIMAMGTSEKRIHQYEESRKAFAEADLGLGTWILAIKQQHPEFANVTSSFNGSGGGYQASIAGTSVAASNASSAPAQAPYYQQYLNATSPAPTGPPPTTRTRLGSSSLSTQATSAFGNSSNQIGTKSKEFMHSAGKMGKGLLSKGRSKLRGTGDKGEPIPPPVVHPPPKPKKEKQRRASWSISIGSRSRTEPTASPDKEKKWLSGYYPPSSSQSRRMRAFRPASWGSSGETGRRRVSLGSLSSRLSGSRGSSAASSAVSSAVSSKASLNDDAHEASGSHSRAGHDEAGVTTPVGRRSRWDPFKFKQRQKHRASAPPPGSVSAPVLSLSIPATAPSAGPLQVPAAAPAVVSARAPSPSPPSPTLPAPPAPPSPLASPPPAAPASTVSATSSIRDRDRDDVDDDDDDHDVSSECSGVQLHAHPQQDHGSLRTHEDETASMGESDEVSFSDDEWVEIVTPHSTAASIRLVLAEPALVEARPSLSLTTSGTAAAAAGTAAAAASARAGAETRLTPQTPASRSQASFQAVFQAAQAAQAAQAESGQAVQVQATTQQTAGAGAAQINLRQPPAPASASSAVAQAPTKPPTQQSPTHLDSNTSQSQLQSPQTQSQPPKVQAQLAQHNRSRTNILARRRRTKEMSFSSAQQQLQQQLQQQQQQPAPVPLPAHLQRHEAADDVPKRNSSFIGLPPIRRGSTFGMTSPVASTSQAARPATERFSLDDDDEVPEARGPPQGFQAPPQAPPPAAISGPPVPAPGAVAAAAAGPRQLSGNATVAGNGATSDAANFEAPGLPLLPLLPLLPPQQQRSAVHPTPATSMSPDQPVDGMSSPQGPPGQPGPVGNQLQPQQPPSSAQHQLQERRVSSPFGGSNIASHATPGTGSGSSSGAPTIQPNLPGNPINKFPPSGPWKLEESHLAEPLHSVSRNRAGTGDSSSQPPYFGFDKETGVTLPHQAPPPPVVPPETVPSPRPRHKASDVPPSSTRRYPDLFGDTRARSNSNVGPPPQPGPAVAPGRLSQDIGLPRAEPDGTGDEPGRRKGSSLLDRFIKPPSERRGSSAEPSMPQPPAPSGPANEQPGPRISVSEGHPDRRKAPRGSFLFSIKKGSPMQPPPPPQQSVPPPAQRQTPIQAPIQVPMQPPAQVPLQPPAQAPLQPPAQAPLQPPMQPPPSIGQNQSRPETPQSQSQSERKHSRFGSGLGAIAGGLKAKPPGIPPTSASSMINESSSSTEQMTPPKKRFSGFGTRFHRSSMDVVPKPGTPGSMRPSTGNATPDPLAPPPSIGFMRSNTDGPSPFSQPKVQAQGQTDQDRRRRRGSTSDFISGMLGYGKKDQSQSGPPGVPQGQNQPLPQLPPAQNPLGQNPTGPSPMMHSPGQFDPRQPQGQFPPGQLPPGHPGLRQNPQGQVSNGQPLGMAPRLPPLGTVSPVQLQEQMSWDPAPSGQPSLPAQSPTPPPGPRRMTGTPSLDSQVQMDTERRDSSDFSPPDLGRVLGDAHQNASQVSLNPIRPSPLGQGSPLTSKATTSVPSTHDSPRPSLSTAIPPPGDNASTHMRSGSRDMSPTRSVPISRVSNHNSKPSLDTAIQHGSVADATEPQRPAMGSPSLSFRSAVPGHSRTDSHSRDELPLSPVSQMSRTGPPSIASSNLGQSPRLASAAAAVTVRARGPQPGTPSLPLAYSPPPVQYPGFATEMAPPQQQHSTPTSPLQQQLQQQQGLPSPGSQQHQQRQGQQPPSSPFQQQRGHQPPSSPFQQQQGNQPPSSPFQQQQGQRPPPSPFQPQQQQQKAPSSPFQPLEQKALSSVAPQPPQQQRQQHPPSSPFQHQGQQQKQQAPAPQGMQQQRLQQQALGPQQSNGPSRTQSPSLQTRESFQTVPSPSTQSSIPVSRPSLQMTGPPGLQMQPKPHGPPPAMLNHQAGQATSSKWTVLRNRMSGQMPKQPHEQAKPEGKTSKLFSAFKRSSKTAPPQQQQHAPQGHQGQQGHHGLHGFFHPHQGQHPQGVPMQQPMYPPGQQMQPGQPMPPGQQMMFRQQMHPGQQMPPGNLRPGQQLPPPLGQRMMLPPGQPMMPGQQVPPGQMRPSQPMPAGYQMVQPQQMRPVQPNAQGQQVRPGQQQQQQQQQARPGQQNPPVQQQSPPGQQPQVRPGQQSPLVQQQQQQSAPAQQSPRPEQQQSPPPQQLQSPVVQSPAVQQQGHSGSQSPPGQQQRPAQSTPVGQLPQGQFPQGQSPPGQSPPGQSPPGQFPPGQSPPGQSPPGQQARPGQQQQFVGQVSHPQSYARRHASQLPSHMVGQQQQPQPPAAPASPTVVGPRQAGPKGFRPFQAQSQAQPQPKPQPKQQPKQQRSGQPLVEPEYDQVPIPQGYSAVHGEGIVIPSPYHIGRTLNHQDSFQHPPQQQAPPQQLPQVYSQPQSPASMTGPPVIRGQPLPQSHTPLSPPTSPQNDRPVGVSPGHQMVREVRAPQAPGEGSVGDSWQAPPQEQRVATNASQVPLQVQRVATNASPANSHGSGTNSGTSSKTPGNDMPGHVAHMNSVSALGSETQSNGPRSPPQPSSENGFLRPQDATRPLSLTSESTIPTMEPASPVGDEQNGTREAYSRPISLSPPIGANGKPSPSVSHAYSTSAVSDEPNVVVSPANEKAPASSTEELVNNHNDGVRLHVANERQEDVPQRAASKGALLRAKTRNRGAPAELADTEDAHTRKIRLEGQEEKIFFDPDADSDGEPAPQMSATSYPGQEWNPYGMPEFGEWNE